LEGLCSYQTWNGFDGFWQNGAVLETISNYDHYTNSTRYSKTLFSSLREIDELLIAYGPQPSFDDMAWYAMAYVRIYEVHNRTDFLERSTDIYNWIWQNGWDSNPSSECHGFWWDNNLDYKASITNVQMLFLGSKMARLHANTIHAKKFQQKLE
jgi:mannan endo-1,6-alpha-mannosidase